MRSKALFFSVFLIMLTTVLPALSWSSCGGEEDGCLLVCSDETSCGEVPDSGDGQEECVLLVCPVNCLVFMAPGRTLAPDKWECPLAAKKFSTFSDDLLAGLPADCFHPPEHGLFEQGNKY